MPYALHWEKYGVHKLFSGTVSEEEFLDSVNAVHGSTNFDTMRYALNDFSNVTDHHISPSTFETYTALTIGSTYSHPRSRIHTIFVTSDEALRKAIHSHQKEGDPYYTTLIFTTLAEARQWIEEHLIKSL
jgi:hypothetical protein